MLFNGVNNGVITPAVSQATATFPNIIDNDFFCPTDNL
jgi:hypothetical protein